MSRVLFSKRVRARLLCKNRPNFRYMEVHYKNTIDDPAATAHAVNTFLGGKLDEENMRQAVQRELYRNRRG